MTLGPAATLPQYGAYSFSYSPTRVTLPAIPTSELRDKLKEGEQFGP